jgi:hypothetical protein
MEIKCLICWATAALNNVDSSYFGLEISRVIVIQLVINLWAYSAAQRPIK